MNKLPSDPQLPEVSAPGFRSHLYKLLRDIFTTTNHLIEDTNTYAAAIPTTGTHLAGEKVWNSAPTELGTAASKYVITGWICVSSGIPGTWREMRTLTGN